MNRDLVALAVKKAAQSEISQRHGAVLVATNGWILANGTNMAYETPNAKFRNKWSLHAEMSCLRKALKKYRLGTLAPWVMVVVRINPRGELRYSRPCPDCARVLEGFGIRYAFSTDDGH